MGSRSFSVEQASFREAAQPTASTSSFRAKVRQRVDGANRHMKVMEIRDKFAVDCLQLVERPDQVPGPGQVVLKMPKRQKSVG